MSSLLLNPACSLLPFQAHSTESPDEMQVHDVRDADRFRQIYLGMSMKEVKSFLGNPQHVEIAGDLRLKHQKWIYDSNPIRGSTLRPVRVLYFESGQVAGWENLGS